MVFVLVLYYERLFNFKVSIKIDVIDNIIKIINKGWTDKLIRKSKNNLKISSYCISSTK